MSILLFLTEKKKTKTILWAKRSGQLQLLCKYTYAVLKRQEAYLLCMQTEREKLYTSKVRMPASQA